MDRKLPYFKDEAEEARWWYDHREEVGAEIIKAGARELPARAWLRGCARSYGLKKSCNRR